LVLTIGAVVVRIDATEELIPERHRRRRCGYCRASVELMNDNGASVANRKVNWPVDSGINQ
jgi:hypothetical protein